MRRIDDARSSRRAMQSVQQVGFDVEVRKKQPILEYVAEASLVRRQVDAASAVEQRLAVDDDASALRTADARDRIDDAGLARARATEQADDRRLGAKRDLELERPEALLDVNVDHRPAVLRDRRVSHSEAISAAIDRTTAKSDRRSAWASPPGICVNV